MIYCAFSIIHLKYCQNCTVIIICQVYRMVMFLGNYHLRKRSLHFILNESRLRFNQVLSIFPLFTPISSTNIAGHVLYSNPTGFQIRAFFFQISKDLKWEDVVSVEVVEGVEAFVAGQEVEEEWSEGVGAAVVEEADSKKVTQAHPELTLKFRHSFWHKSS